MLMLRTGLEKLRLRKSQARFLEYVNRLLEYVASAT